MGSARLAALESTFAILSPAEIHAALEMLLRRAGICRAPTPKAASATDLPEVARLFHRHSLRRPEIVGHGIDDPSWNMLLILYADAASGGSTSISSACFASGGPSTTALRHLNRMEADGLITRRPDPTDSRRSFVEPTPLVMARMEKMVVSFCVAPPPTPAE